MLNDNNKASTMLRIKMQLKFEKTKESGAIRGNK